MKPKLPMKNRDQVIRTEPSTVHPPSQVAAVIKPFDVRAYLLGREFEHLCHSVLEFEKIKKEKKRRNEKRKRGNKNKKRRRIILEDNCRGRATESSLVFGIRTELVINDVHAGRNPAKSFRYTFRHHNNSCNSRFDSRNQEREINFAHRRNRKHRNCK